MKGPFVATMQHFDLRIMELEDRISLCNSIIEEEEEKEIPNENDINCVKFEIYNCKTEIRILKEFLDRIEKES